MERQAEVLDFTDYSKEEILERVREILDESYIEKFTLLLKRVVHLSKSERKFEEKDNAIQKIKRRYSTTQISPNLLDEKENFLQTINEADHTPPMKKKPTQGMTSLRSRNPSQAENSIFNFNQKMEQLSKGGQLYLEGEYEMALIEYFEEEIELKKKLKTAESECEKNMLEDEYSKLMLNVGNCYFCEKDYDKAIEYFQVETSFEIIDEKLMGQRYNNLGSCYAHKKQNQQSLKCFNEALKIYSKYSELDCSNLLKNIGGIYFRSAMYEQAETYFQQSINERKSKSPNNKMALLMTYHKFGICQKYLGKNEQALNTLLLSLSIAERGYSLLDDILKEIAEIYLFQEKYSESLVYFEKLSDSYELQSKCQGTIYESVAKIHLNLGNFSEHDKFMKLAVGEYRKFNNERKLSEISCPKYA